MGLLIWPIIVVFWALIDDFLAHIDVNNQYFMGLLIWPMTLCFGLIESFFIFIGLSIR